MIEQIPQKVTQNNYRSGGACWKQRWLIQVNVDLNWLEKEKLATLTMVDSSEKMQ